MESWKDRSKRLERENLSGDVFHLDDLRQLMKEIGERAGDRTVPAESYLRALGLLVQQIGSHQQTVISLPTDVVEQLIALAPVEDNVVPLPAVSEALAPSEGVA